MALAYLVDPNQGAARKWAPRLKGASNVPMYGAIAVIGMPDIACSVPTFLKDICQETSTRITQLL